MRAGENHPAAARRHPAPNRRDWASTPFQPRPGINLIPVATWHHPAPYPPRPSIDPLPAATGHRPPTRCGQAPRTWQLMPEPSRAPF